MKSRIKEEEKTDSKSYQYEVGKLYIQKGIGVVVLCDRNHEKNLRGVCIVSGESISFPSNIIHYIGEYRADWAPTFQKFEGEIILEQ